MNADLIALREQHHAEVLAFTRDACDRYGLADDGDEPFGIGPGWLRIVEDMLARLVAAGWDRQLFALKSKYCILHVYVGTLPTPRQRRILDGAQARAAAACEWCGGPHNLITPRSGTALCTGCATAEADVAGWPRGAYIDHVRLLETLLTIGPLGDPVAVSDLAEVLRPATRRAVERALGDLERGQHVERVYGGARIGLWYRDRDFADAAAGRARLRAVHDGGGARRVAARAGDAATTENATMRFTHGESTGRPRPSARPTAAMTRARTAYHEAGHAVADERLGFGSNGVHMVRDGDLLGAAECINGPSGDGSEDDLAVVALLSGYAAEVLCSGSSTRATEGGATEDMERARALLERTGRGEAFDEWLSCALSFAAGEESTVRLVARDLRLRGRLCPEEVETLIQIADGDATEWDLAMLRQLMAVDDEGES